MTNHTTNKYANEPFPVDWNEWQAEWRAWRQDHTADLKRSSYCFPGQNFLADYILGVWRINGRDVELSEVTMPDFTNRNLTTLRYVGITYGEPDGAVLTTSGGVVASFAELEAQLGIGEA